MKRKHLIPLICLLFLQVLSSCNKNDDNNEDVIPNYILEENENYKKLDIKEGKLNTLSKSEITIPEIQDLMGNPFSSRYLFNEYYINYPTNELLLNKNILYTSSYYTRNTFNREDDCIEYTICSDNDSYIVTSINKNGNNFIPFNGFVLSLSKDCNVTYNIGDTVLLDGKIKQYEIGFYNQDGKRIVVDNINSCSWSFDGVNLYDNNTLDKTNAISYSQVSSINFLYNKKEKAYKVSKFRRLDYNSKVYTNVNDGFVLMGSNNKDYLTNNNFALFEGVRFNLNDTIKVEEEAKVLNNYYEFSLNGSNSFIYQKSLNESTINFNISLKEFPSTTSPWAYEILLDKDGYIIDVGSHVNYLKEGKILSLTVLNNTIAEELNLVFNDVFLIGSKITINKNDIIVDNSMTTRIESVYQHVASYVYEKIDEFEVSNYAYNIDKLKEISNTIDNIQKEKNNLINSKDETLKYRLYTLIGKLMQQYYIAYSSCIKNEAVQVKSCWYIEDFNNNDYDINTIKKNLLKIKNANFNEIIVGVINDGTAYYNNSKYFKLNSQLTYKNYNEHKNDFIKAISDEAHKLNMKVFACFTPFTTGLEKAFLELNDAFALTIDGKDSVKTSQGIVKMLDPANETFKEKVKLVIDDILSSNPSLDGIHLDYIRYGADNNQVSYMTGVTEQARLSFNTYCKENNISYNVSSLDELRNLLKTSTNFFNAFNVFQQTLITNTVKLIKDVCLDYSKPLTCAVADNYNLVKTWKCQDFGKWAKDKIVDGLYLMDYYFDDYYVNKYFKDMVNATNNNCLLVSGIDPSYASLSAIFYPKVVKGAICDNESSGFAIFGTHTQNAKKDGWDLIKDSSWIDSISPYDSLANVLDASFSLLLNRCNEIYIKYNNQTKKQLEQLENDINKILLLKENENNCSKIIELLNNMCQQNYANNEANNRINEQLLYIKKLVETKMNIIKK